MNVMKPTIRFATPDDSKAILDIYAPYVVSTAVTFETSVPRLYDFRRRIINISSSLPFLVCEIDGKIAGYAYASVPKARAAYAWNAYVSVYISNEYQRCNIASALYLAVISLLKAQGYRKVLAVVTSSNGVSESFHSAFGFKKVGTIENAGYKHGWQSVSVFEKSLSDDMSAPAPTKSVAELDCDFCERNFAKCAKIIKMKN